MDRSPLSEKPLQPFLQEIALSMAAILGLDVTIVDENLTRIAGTGSYARRIGESVSGTSSFGRVLGDGLPRFVSNPRNDTECVKCEDRQTCTETSHLAFPLGGDGRPLGVLSLVAFSDVQRDRLIDRRQECVQFLNHVARLVWMACQREQNAAELVETRDQLAGIVDAIREGIIAIDARARVICCNPAAAEILRLSKRRFIGRPLEELFPDAPLLQVLRTGQGYVNLEATLSHPRGSLRHITTGNPLFSRGRVVGAVALLKTLKDVHRIAYDVSERQPERPIDHLLGQDAKLQQAKSMALRAAQTNSSVLLLGESGTGKELFARAIHYHSQRSRGPFVVVNCAALPEELLESELFGYEEGAFTGARRGGKPGKFELAAGGTLFLDEVADCSLRLQPKLLRALDQKEVQRVGGTRTSVVDVRLVAATNRDLQALVRQKEFREDLFYRISVIPIGIPPLRERKGDIPLLLDEMLKRHARSIGRAVPALSASARNVLIEYSWPGNVRELENTVQYLLHACEDQLVKVAHLPQRILLAKNDAPSNSEVVATSPAPMSRSTWERQVISDGLAAYGHNRLAKELIAKQLGVSRATIYRKIKQYGLSTGR